MTADARIATEVSLSLSEKTVLLTPQTAAARSKKNQEILIFTCTAFFLFAMAEVVGAVASNSLSLLGDAGAMSIDVFTVSSPPLHKPGQNGSLAMAALFIQRY